MQYIIFFKKDNFQYIKEYNGSAMCILGIFLMCDVVNRSSFKEFAFTNEEETYSNSSYLVKQGNNIRIEDLYDNRETDDKPAFIISKEEYIKLLDMWVEVYNQKPDEILVTYENGKINVEAINKT